MRKKIILSLVIILAANGIFCQIELINEDFQQGIPSNWTVITNDLFTPVDPNFVNGWISIVDPENNLDTVAASTSYFSPVGISNRWLITPPLSLGAFGNSISWKSKSHDPSFPDDYLVLVSKTGNQIADFVDTIGEVIEENFEWTFRATEFDNQKFASQTIYVAFINTTNNGFKLYLDSVKVEKEDVSILSEIQDVKLLIYPNPTTEILHIQTSFDVSNVTIYNGNGQIASTNNKSKNINVSTLVPGFYYIEVEINGYKVTQRFLKE